MSFVLGFFLTYYAATLLWYSLPVLAVRFGRAPVLPPDPRPNELLPSLVVVAPCRSAPDSIAGMIAALKKQDYPLDRFRIVILVDTIDRNDPSASVARSQGVEVYERFEPIVMTKGAALNELLERQLQREPWDALIVMDIDVRPSPHYLTRLAAYLLGGSQVIQSAPISKNADESPETRLNHLGQLLSQMLQRGRSLLGLSAILSGSGMVFSREAMKRLQFKTVTGTHLSDDGELHLRCLLHDLHVSYGGDLRLLNDLPGTPQWVRKQRANWFSANIEGLDYFWPLLRKGLGGDWRALEGLFAAVFLPGSSLLFAVGGVSSLALAAASLRNSRFFSWFAMATGLWVLHGLYYFFALQTVGDFLRWQELKRLPHFLWVRARAVIDGVILGSRRNPGKHSNPSPHHEGSIS